MRRKLLIVLTLVAACSGVFLGGRASAGTDPDTMTVAQKLVLSWQPADPSRACENRLEIDDSSKPQPAPMLWDGCVGLMSGGDGGKLAGGRVCVTYYLLPINCLSVYGTLQMTPTGPNGPTGPTQTWRPSDVAYVQAMERAGITPRRLLRLIRLMNRLGIR